MRTETIQIFQFDELSDDAKGKARDWFRECIDANDFTCIVEDFIEVAWIFGVDIARRTNSKDLAVYWSGFYSQGDGACFEGSYQYKKGAAKAIRAYAPKDETLHRIVDELQALQRRYFYSLTATMQHRGHYYHSGCMAVEVRDSRHAWGDSDGFADDTLTQIMRDFADWIYNQLKAEYEYRMSDESVDESIKANECEFYSDGKRAA